MFKNNSRHRHFYESAVTNSIVYFSYLFVRTIILKLLNRNCQDYANCLKELLPPDLHKFLMSSKGCAFWDLVAEYKEYGPIRPKFSCSNV